MFNSFDVLETNNINFQYVILNKDFISFENKLFQVEKFLKRNHFSGTIIFNTFSTTKDFSRMNSTVYFDGEHFRLSTVKNDNIIDTETLSLINKNLKKYNYFN